MINMTLSASYKWIPTFVIICVNKTRHKPIVCSIPDSWKKYFHYQDTELESSMTRTVWKSISCWWSMKMVRMIPCQLFSMEMYQEPEELWIRYQNDRRHFRLFYQMTSFSVCLEISLGFLYLCLLVEVYGLSNSLNHWNIEINTDKL